MTDEQWQTAWKLFQSAGSIPPEKAREFLDTASSDPAVRDALIELLHPAGGPDRLNCGGNDGKVQITSGSVVTLTCTTSGFTRQ